MISTDPAWNMVPTKHTLLTSRLSQLQDIWLQPLCPSCNRLADVACVVLAMKLGKHRVLKDILPRLKCSVCGAAPSLVKAADQPIPPAHLIGAGTWVVPVLP
jgi:hypothetical protein